MKKLLFDMNANMSDLLALLVAKLAPDLDLIAVTTVWGDVAATDASDIVKQFTEQIALDIPVYTGMQRPLAKDLSPGRWHALNKKQAYVNRSSGPLSKNGIQFKPAPLIYRNLLESVDEPVSILATGPLTNLAVALSLWPNLAKRIADITIVGGSIKVNNIGFSERNFWYDPEAVQIVLDAGLNPYMIPYDTTERVKLSANECCEIVYQNYVLPLADINHVLKSIIGVASIVSPSILQFIESVHCQIGVGEKEDGHCSLDRREGIRPANAELVYEINRERLLSFLTKTFKVSGETKKDTSNQKRLSVAKEVGK